MNTVNASSGVYLFEEDRSTYVQGTVTSPCAAVFVANKGPVGVPQAVFDRDDFVARYGTPSPSVSLAPHAIIKALEETNRVYCVRVATGAEYGGVVVSYKAGNQLQMSTTTATAGTAVGATLSNGSYSYRVVATDVYGNSLPGLAAAATVVTSPITATLTTSLAGTHNDLLFTSVATGVAGNSNAVQYVDPAANSAPLGVVITPSGSTATVVVSLATNGSGAITTTANDVYLLLQAQGAAFSNYMSVTFASGNDGSGVVTALASTTLAGGAASGANNGRVTISWTAVTGATGYRVYGRTSGSELFIAAVDGSTTSYVDTGALTPAGALPGANTTSQLKIAPLGIGLADPVNDYIWQTGDLFLVYGKDPGTWNNNLRLAITKVSTLLENFRLEVYEGTANTAAEAWDCTLVEAVDGFGRQSYIEDRINPISRNINVAVNPNPLAVTALTNTYTTKTAMAGGDNGTTPTDFDVIEGWQQFEDSEEYVVRWLINGGYTSPEVHNAMDVIAKNRKDCVALLDFAEQYQTANEAVNYRNNILNIDSTYSAMYVCDQQVVDTYTDKLLYIPPSGYIAKALARSAKNYFPWFAAAGMDRGDVDSLRSRHFYKQGERDIMAENQVNYIRTFKGRGRKIWEQFTATQRPSASQYLSVRTLMIYTEQSIKEALLWYVFDPGDDITRQRIKGIIDAFMRRVQASRGVYRFETVIDKRNNAPSDIQAGNMNIWLYVDPVIPARRLLFKAIVTATGAEFTEATVVANS